jgi:CheY-like chemotaxis protein
MDGITAAQHLKKSMPEIPIILFTMYGLSPERAQELGADAVVSKPEGLDKLSKEVHLLLSR